jgi:CHAT domain-containing protein
MGDLEAGLSGYRRAIARAEQAHSALFVDEWRMEFLETEPRLIDEFLGALLAHRSALAPEAIWRWVARARSRLPAANPDRATHDRPLAERRASVLRRELESCYTQLGRLQAGHARRIEPTRVRSMERRALALEARLRRFAATAPPVAQVTASTPAPAIADGEAHVVYFSAGGRLAALRRDRAGWRLFRDLGPLEEIERLLRLFHHQMEARGSDAAVLRTHGGQIAARAVQHLAALGQRVLEPVLEPGIVRLRISPYGPLFRAPFHALAWRGAPLIERCVVAIDPGFAMDYRAAPADRRGALVIGFDGPAQGAAEREALAVAKILEGSGIEVRSRIGAGAKRSEVLDAAEGVSLVHLGGHGVFRLEHPEFSALRLGDGWLTTQDLAALPLRGAAVVLSACETGPRGAVAGTEMLGLVRGLARAGTAAVVASLWRVDDEGTLTLMQALYESWRRRGLLGAALREVQWEAARRGEEPYLWASFCLTGDPDVPWPQPLSEPSCSG